ncbi:MAG: transketolase C-terminal domain-containing protein [Phycisphaerae bacterium]|jgi:transketolase|nr:transketolase C-terminal domain-containing protein [Phycisphaerae bacterium]
MSTEATRDRFGEALLQLAREDKNVIAMDCDLGRSTRAFHITKTDESRFLEMGISEQDMISTAAGMAHEGKIVFVNTFAVFATGRCFDQIRQQLSLARLNVKVCGSSAGLTQGPDGATHQSVLDVSLMRTLPNMVVIVPADGPQTEAAVNAAYNHQGPVYLRLSRYDCENVYEEGYPHDIYKAVELKEGKDAAIIVCGPILHHAIEAAELLEKDGVSAGVINIPVVKPLDTEAVIAAAEKYRVLVVVEEHSVYGGLGSAVAEVVAEMKGTNKAVVAREGIKDDFGESGTADDLLNKHELDAEGIVKKVMRNI